MFWDLLSTFTDTAGKIVEGNAQAKAATFNSNMSRYNATTIRDSGALEENRIRREGRQAIGLIRANVGGSGFEMEGSALDVLAMSAYNNEYDAQISHFNTNAKATSAEMQGKLYSMEAKDARRSTILSASSTLLKGTEPLWSGRQGTQPFKLGGASDSSYTVLSDGSTIRWNE